MVTTERICFSIEEDNPEFSADLLGGKGYGLAKMKAAGVNVPPAYVITTEACREYMKDPEAVMARVKSECIPMIEKGLTEKFGYMPLVSVRSGAKFSMPGMMDTILNVGLDKSNLKAWTKRLNPECVGNSYERLIEMYGSVVGGIERKNFEGLCLAERIKLYSKEVGETFPNADEQLIGAIEAVFQSWNNERAKSYRKMNGISDALGTAVTVQAMVFGNMSDKSCTGVLFSRDPSSGERKVTGEFLVNAQGEDVVAGIRTPLALSGMRKWNKEVYKELLATVEKLEVTAGDMQDIEFTVQEGELFILQTRNAKRTAQAAVRVAVELVEEGKINIEEAVKRVTLKQFLAAVRPVIDPEFKKETPAAGKGIPASNGCVTGIAVFSSADAVNCKSPCILISEETTPDDIEGMNAAVGILTSTGGATSHAAVVARGMDKVCVVGCTDLSNDAGSWTLENENVVYPINAGDKVTLDGATGEIWINVEVPIVGGEKNPYVKALVSMIEERYSLYRTVTSAEEFNGAKRLLVATYMLDRKVDSILPVRDGMEKMLVELGEREAVFDLRPFSEFVREADEKLEYVFGSGPSAKEIIAEKINRLLSWKNASGKVKVLGLGLTPVQVESLRENDYEVIEAVDSISALIAANGLCVPDYDALLKKASEQDVVRIVALKKKAGEEIRSFNVAEEVDPEDLQRGAVFALSAMQVAQSLLP